MVARHTRGTGETKQDQEREQVTVEKADLAGGSNKRAFAGDHLLSFVERIERLTEEIDALGDDRKEVFSEAKGTGFDSKTLRKVIARRKMHNDDRMEMDALQQMYEDAIKEAEQRKLKASLDAGGDA